MTTDNNAPRKLTPEQKAATVIVSLGADKASKIYKHLTSDEVEKLTLEVAKLGHVKSEQTEEVLDEFYKSALTQKIVTDGGIEYARSVLEKAYGESTAKELLQKMSKYLKTRSFDFIRKTDAQSLFSVLQYERPQMMAMVLSYADAAKAAAVIMEMPEERRIKIVESIARLKDASPDAIKIVESQLRRKFTNILTTDYTTIGGVDYIADVMNNMDRANEKLIFDELNKKDPELADDIRKRMFVFEDIRTMDNRSIQRFIRECDMKDLVYAMKGADDDISELFYSNMSQRMAETIRSDLEITINVRLRDVEEAQQRIVNVIRKLDEEGELIINKGGGKDEIIA